MIADERIALFAELGVVIVTLEIALKLANGENDA